MRICEWLCGIIFIPFGLAPIESLLNLSEALFVFDRNVFLMTTPARPPPRTVVVTGESENGCCNRRTS